MTVPKPSIARVSTAAVSGLGSRQPRRSALASAAARERAPPAPARRSPNPRGSAPARLAAVRCEHRSRGSSAGRRPAASRTPSRRPGVARAQGNPHSRATLSADWRAWGQHQCLLLRPLFAGGRRSRRARGPIAGRGARARSRWPRSGRAPSAPCRTASSTARRGRAPRRSRGRCRSPRARGG